MSATSLPTYAVGPSSGAPLAHLDQCCESGLATMPSDVLTFMASFIPFHPRLLVFSVLAKRFRLAALRSVTSLPARIDPASIDFVRYDGQVRAHVAYDWQSLRLFSSLSALDIDEVAMGENVLKVVPPASLLRLSVRLVSRSPVIIANFTHLTCLTTLELSFRDFSPPVYPDPAVKAFLLAIESSLTSLTLICDPGDDMCISDTTASAQLSAPHLPHLVSLRIGGHSNLLSLVRQHASQLTSFSTMDVLIHNWE